MIIQGACNSFRLQLLEAIHDFTNDAIYMALYNESADINPNTTIYTSSGEVTGSGYTAGGQPLVGTVGTAPGVAWVNWDPITWTVDQDTFRARGALIYNFTKGNKAVLVMDFGVVRFPSSGVFTITFPPAPSLNAILRLT